MNAESGTNDLHAAAVMRVADAAITVKPIGACACAAGPGQVVSARLDEIAPLERDPAGDEAQADPTQHHRERRPGREVGVVAK